MKVSEMKQLCSRIIDEELSGKRPIVRTIPTAKQLKMERIARRVIREQLRERRIAQ